jgi:hypothetical protein
LSQTQENGRLPEGPGFAWAALALLVALYALALLRAEPPPVVARDAPGASFSGERALADLVRIEGTGRPHPIGSAENARVQREITTTLAAAGLTAEVDEHLAIGANGVIAVTRNIVARLPGRASTKSVLVCAHHDSVSAGPGTSDDGVGVAAALEIARALGALGERRNDVVFLIDDGEEAGLIGAGAFLAHHPLAPDVGVVVNMEARGTNGRAQMFETSVGNRSLIAALYRGVPHPSASSVAYELYKKMPNDTDLTVFKAHTVARPKTVGPALKPPGIAGLNFAFIGGLARYHTPRDDVAHLDPRSLQHIGESALGVVKELVNQDLTQLADGDAVYADVLGFTLIHFPVGWILPLAIVALPVLAWSACGVERKRFARDFVALCLGLVASLGGASAIAWCLTTARGAAFPWSAHPAWTRVAVLLGSLAFGAWIARLVSPKREGAPATRQAAHIVYALLGVVTAITVPSASYLFVFPALAAALLSPLKQRFERLIVLVPLVVAALFTFPVLIGVEDGFGYGAPVGAVVGLIVVLAQPAFAEHGARPLACAGVTAALALAVAFGVPCFDADAPAWLNIVHEHDARSGEARWIALPALAPLPRELASAAAFEERDNAFPDRCWIGARPGFVAPAAPARAAPPRLDVVGETREGAGRVVRAKLWSPRGALRFVVRVPEGAELRSIARGTERLQVAIGAGGRARFTGIDGPGVVLEFRVPAGGAIDVDFADASSEMPSEFEALSRARPAHYVPRGEGDVSVIQERVRL